MAAGDILPVRRLQDWEWRPEPEFPRADGSNFPPSPSIPWDNYPLFPRKYQGEYPFPPAMVVPPERVDSPPRDSGLAARLLARLLPAPERGEVCRCTELSPWEPDERGVKLSGDCGRYSSV